MAAKPVLHPYWRGAAAFAIIVAAAMLLLLVWQLLRGVPEFATMPLPTWSHVIGQAVTAVLLLIAGFALIAQKSWSRNAYLVGIGALLLSVINAVAFYGARSDIGLVIFFIALAVAGVFFALRAEE